MNVEPKPVIRWAGGKWRMRQVLLDALPTDVGARRHVELFAGSLALWLARGAPGGAVLNDACLPLIGLYKCLGDPTERRNVLRALERHASKHSRKHYLAQRERFNTRMSVLQVTSADAARFLYVNRASYNGLYRVNGRGGFNTPYGGDARQIRLPPIIPLGRALAAADLRCTTICPEHAGDWGLIRRAARTDDFVYIDPPYAPTTANSFTGYGPRFSFEEHMRLRDLAEFWGALGAKVMVTNADVPFVRDIYRRWKVRPVKATRSIGGAGAKRGAIGEVLITNY